MQMDNPKLMNATGAPWNLPIPADSASIRDYLYIHMWVSCWAGQYAIGEMSPLAVKVTVRNELFNSQAGRSYWAAVGQRLLDTSTGQYHRFSRILDEEYRKIEMSNIPAAAPIRTNHEEEKATSGRMKGFCYLGLAAGAVVAGVLAGQRLNPPDHRVR